MDARIVDGRKIARVTDDGKLKVLVHGRDGDDLVPVKVSEDGYLMLATDVTVESVTVDLGTVELNQGAPGQNPWPVTLSGTDVVIGLLADRPPASEMRGRGYYAWDETDGHKLTYSNGTNWVVNQ